MFPSEKNSRKKYGEILLDINTINTKEKLFIFNCTFCNIEYDLLDKFSTHIEEHLNIDENVLKGTVNKFATEPEKISMPSFIKGVKLNNEIEIDGGASNNGIIEEIPENPDYNEQFVINEIKVENEICVEDKNITAFVIHGVKKEPEDDANLNDICGKEETTDYYREQLVVNEAKLEDEYTENAEVINSITEADGNVNNISNSSELNSEIGVEYNSITEDDNDNDSISDSSELIEIIIENSTSESDNEELEQNDKILHNKRKTKNCIEDESKKFKSMVII